MDGRESLSYGPANQAPSLGDTDMEIVGRIFAGIGAAGVLCALTFVSILIGIIIHGMVILMAGKPIDGFFQKRGETPFEPGTIK